MRRFAKAALVSTSALAGLALAPPLLAQERPETTATTLQELIVTAQKREESAQEVPIALTALSGENLQRQGVTGFQDLSTRVPALRFGSGVTGGENVITLRGVSSQNTTSGGDSPVAYNLDGVYLARTTAVDPEFFDIDRIEVLRGPQGTLYGRNSVGGTVNVITRHPVNTFGAHADALVGNYDARIARAWINAPIFGAGTDQYAAVRIAAVYANHDGYQKNLFKGPGASNDADGQDFWMVRGSVYWKFSEQADLLLIASASWNGDPVATKTWWIEAPGRYVGAQPFLTNPREVRKNTHEMFDQKGRYASATFNYDLRFATLTSVTGWASGKWAQSNDPDASELTIALNPYWTLDQWQWSEEVRLASNPSDNPLSWIAGAFFFREKAGQTFQYIDTGLNSATPFTDNFVFTNGGIYKTESKAVFGQADYDFGKAGWLPLTLTLGARYTWDNKKGFDFLDFQLPLLGLAFPQSKTFDESWEQATWRVGARYQFNPQLMAYASFSTGYLSGGGLVGNFPGIYRPEKVKAYEAGFKTTLLDGRLLFNGAAYRQEITDMQVFVQDITGSRIDNAGEAHVKGIELEAVFTPIEGLRLNAAATFTEAEYDSYLTINNRFAGAAPGCDPVTRLCDFSGNRLIQTPEHTFTVGAQYTFDTALGSVTPRVDVFRSGDLFFLSANSPLERQKAYTLVDANITWRSADRRWTLEAFVRNATDEDVISNDGLQSNTIGSGFGIDNYTYYPPRTYGVRLGVDF